MWARATFNKLTYRQEGRAWWEWHQIALHQLQVPLSITFAFVATHNHFALDRDGRVFNRHAPVIKLERGAGEDRHLELLSVLNSSTACFWLKQVCANKGNGGMGGGIKGNVWDRGWEFDGTKVQQLPIPSNLNGTSSHRISSLCDEMAGLQPLAIAASGPPTEERLAEARRRYNDLRLEAIAAQERLDWEIYGSYGLLDDDLSPGDVVEPPLQFGERAFEIVLARQIASGTAQSAWFSRHGSVARTEVPAHWPDEYRRLVERRMKAIECEKNIGLIETPEYKRRWSEVAWDDQVAAARRSWLLDRLESPHYWPTPAAITTVARLTAAARADEDFVHIARLLTGRQDVDLAAVIDELITEEAVAYLAAHRYTESGVRTHAEWLRTWDLQRREDAGQEIGRVPVPPRYGKTDFTGSGWAHRGKLDVPKERFIAYPGAERETDASAVVGWAGWDHLERARALASWYLQARRDGRDKEHLTQLLAGLAELVPWLKQWYDDPNTDPSLDRPGSQVAALIETELRSLGLTNGDLAAWRPSAPANRGRQRKVTP